MKLFWNDMWTDWGIAFLSLLAAIVGIRFLRIFVVRWLKDRAARTSSTWDDFFAEMVRVVVIPALYVAACYFFLDAFPLKASVGKAVHSIFVVAIAYFILRVVSASFRKFVTELIRGRENQEMRERQARGLVMIVTIVIWLVGILFLIDNLGYNVTTLVAGLGIGGIAVALAAQTILGDLFSYFVIFFDRPFEIGDFIVMEDKAGTVEQIGIKTTRIRTLGGEQLICANTDLTGSRIHNFKRLERRRVVFNLRVSYRTLPEELKAIPGMVKEIISAQPLTAFDRGHFSLYGEFSLNFEFVYFILNADYNFFMDVQQAIYLEIFRIFREKGIEFAYPTQRLLVEPPVSQESGLPG